MKVIYAHDERLQKYDGNYYSSGSLGNSLNDKYLMYFDKITLLLRSEKLNQSNFVNRLKKINGENIQVVEIPDFRVIKYKQYKEINTIIKNEVRKADKVIARLPSFIGNLAIKYAKHYKKAYAIELVGCPWDAFINHGSIKAKLLAPLQYCKTRSEIRKCKNVLYVTNKFLQIRYPNKQFNVACSDVEIADVEESILKNRLNISLEKKETISIGLIGSMITEYKGHKCAFKAINLLKDKYNIILYLIGYGDLKQWKPIINRLDIEKNVVFDGIKESGAEVWKWLDNIDIYIQPSLTEGLPRGVIEAMSRGCPIISTNIGGFPEIVDKNFMIEKDDYIKLANKIEILIKNNNLYRSQCSRSFNKAKLFIPDKLNKIRQNFYNNIH